MSDLVHNLFKCSFMYVPCFIHYFVLELSVSSLFTTVAFRFCSMLLLFFFALVCLFIWSCFIANTTWFSECIKRCLQCTIHAHGFRSLFVLNNVSQCLRVHFIIHRFVFLKEKFKFLFPFYSTVFHFRRFFHHSFTLFIKFCLLFLFSFCCDPHKKPIQIHRQTWKCINA